MTGFTLLLYMSLRSTGSLCIRLFLLSHRANLQEQPVGKFGRGPSDFGFLAWLGKNPRLIPRAPVRSSWCH